MDAPPPVVAPGSGARRSFLVWASAGARRFFLVATLCLIACAWAAGGGAGTARADAPQVTIVTPGGAQHTLSLEALAGTEDVVGRTYTLRSPDGENTDTVTGFSLAHLIEAAGIDPYGFSYLEVQRPGGGAVALSSAQALAAGAFAEGPPVVYASPTGTGFLRPGAGTGDDNAADSFEAPQGLTIALRKGASLQVKIEASPRRTVPGEAVDFRAVAERSGSGEALAYSWYFDDGGRAEGESVSHAFAKPGSYAVVVGLTAAGEDTGSSAVVRIQVGPAPAGPDREGGGHEESAGAPDHGAADGPAGGSSGNQAPGARSGAAPGEAAPSPGASPSAAASPTPRPSPPPRSTPPPDPAPPKPEHRTKPKEKPPHVTKTEHHPQPKPSGPLVSGELLEGKALTPRGGFRAAGVIRPPKLRNPGDGDGDGARARARTGSPRSLGGGGVPSAAWGLGAVAALLGLGALAGSGRFVDLLPRIAERLR